MSIQRGDYVRPNNPSVGLPQGSVWRVVCSAGALKLEPENGDAQRVSRRAIFGCRFPARDFDKVVLCRGQWVNAINAQAAVPFFNPDDLMRDVLASPLRASMTTAVANGEGTVACTQAVDPVQAALSIAEHAVVSAEQKLAGAKEQARKQRVIAAEKAKAKAQSDKAAAAKAKAEEAKRQLAARLHADRCLGEATLALIAEVSRLNNGGAEQIASHSIAGHVDQLQPLARSYGYKIVKPSLLAQVVKL